MFSPRYIIAYSQARTFALSLMLATACAVMLHAQGGSPIQSEFTGQPVPAGPNVNEFTGDFTYGLPVLTVPGPNGSSYSLTLSYQAGMPTTADPSWVGYGWSLNPGAIIRQKRGFPDDWQGQITEHLKVPLDYTVTTKDAGNLEIGSIDFLGGAVPSLGGSVSLRYNSRTGFGKIWTAGGGLGVLGASVGAAYTNENGDGSVEPVLTFNIWSIAASLLLSGNDADDNTGNQGDGETSILDRFLQGSAKKMAEKIGALGNTPNVFRSRELNLAPPSATPLTGHSEQFGNGFTATVSLGVVLGADYTRGGSAMEVRPVPLVTRDAYGYLRSHEALGDDDALMDYYYEKDVPYLLDDKFLPIPFSGADVFTVAGGGSFRAFNRGVPNFRQNKITSEFDIDNDQLTVIFGSGFGAGKRWGDGSITYEADAWENPEAPARQAFIGSGDEPYFFRYSHDMGGSLLFDNDDAPVRASIENHSGFLGDIVNFLRINDIDQYPEMPDDVGLRLESWERPGRVGYIGSTLNGDMLLQKNDKYYKSYTRDSAGIEIALGRDNVADQIGEFALFGPGGSRYLYGLPVFAQAEKALRLGLRDIKFDSAANVHHNFLAYRYLDKSFASTVTGQEFPEKYSVAWLLTEITTPDYVDLTANGPTDDDLGGWTKFGYVSPTAKVHRRYWRQPFRGLAYDARDVSDPEDDLGGYAEGYVQQYYLDRIETATHVALFILNNRKSDTRKDAYPQSASYGAARLAGDSTVTGAVYTSQDLPIANELRYLDRIELYTKGDDGEPDSLLTTVRFEYDYSLRPNMPNSLPVHPDSATRYGMLTLRKVWTESLGVRNARIRPYIFDYEYPKSVDYAAGVRTRYPEVTSFADSLSAADENPSYTPYDFDAWGNYRPGGAARLDGRFPWVPQNDTSDWDPAAWQLKRIRRPSGGEIHVQYEQDDYAFVHDRPAMAMVSIIEKPGTEFQQSWDGDNDNKYYLNLTDIGVDTTDFTAVAKVRDLLKREEKLFFRFLYAFRGDTARLENPEHNSGYLEGYGDLDAIGIDTIDGGMADDWYALYVRLIGYDGASPHDHGLPKKLCWDYVRKRKRGRLGFPSGVSYSTDAGAMVMDLRNQYYSFHEADHCKTMDFAHSYIRIPMTTPKKGGGLRVKRLLAYDPGIEGDSALYGTEYRYEIYDRERNEVISSGVAANEPASMRDENVLVDFLKREANDDDDLDGKVIAADDRVRNEGPIGESLLPSASVGYARIATHPIHQGVTATGFGVTDFYTYRDVPFDGRYNALGRAVDYTRPDVYDYRTSPLFENLLIYRQSEHLIYATQGYRFVLTDFHGKTRRRLSNGGRYSPYEDDWMTGAMTEFRYYEPGDSVPFLYRPGDSLRYGYPGKEMEVVQASRRNGVYMDNTFVEADAGFLFASSAVYFAVDNSELSTHITTKVITYPAIVRGVLTYADGNYNYLENTAFDPRSGNVVATRSRDPFDGLALDQSPGGHVGTYNGYVFPAADVHPEFERIAANERARIQSTESFEIMKGKDGTGRPFLDFPGGSETRWLRKLTPGDLIELATADGDDDAGRYHVDEIAGNVVWLIPSYHYNESSDPSLSVIDEAVHIEVIRSGRENAPGIHMGGVATYGETDQQVATGANFSWSGPGAAARLAFVDQLNDSLLLGFGTFTAANVDTTLKFKLYTTGSCGTLDSLGESFALLAVEDTVFVVVPNFSSAVYTDTLVGIGIGGWFDLDDAGQVVYRVKGRPEVSQRVRNFTFCGDEAHRTVANVFAASATGRLNDTIDYDGGGVASGSGAPSAYEKGERGRWSARTAYAYKTGVTAGSRPVAGERVYKDAGLFDDFSLFNWGEPESSDMTRWFRMDSVTRITKDNAPYSAVDMLGHSSVTLFDYGEERSLLPVLTAWNADEGSVAFESFEYYDDGAFSGDMTDEKAHAGTISLTTEGNNFTIPLIATQQLLDKGLLVRFWMYPLWKTDAKIKLSTGGAPANFSVTSSHRVARADEWALYEYHLDSAALAPLYSVGDTIALWFGKANGGDTIRIDDVKLQPADAIAAGYVFDKRTFRPVAAFDDRNFGTYPQYDAEGKSIRVIVETSRGLKTVAESHIHVPGADRDWLGVGAPFTPTTSYGGGTPTSIGTNPAGNEKSGTSFDVLNLQLDLTGQKTTLFGLDPSKLRDVVQEKVGEFNALTQDERELLDRYEELNSRYTELQKTKDQATTEEAKQRIADELQSIEAERDALLDQLGI